MKKVHETSKCLDCRATKARMYSTDDFENNPEKKEKPRRSFLQAPRSYSKIPAPSSTFSSPSPPVDVQPPQTRPIPIPQASTPSQNAISHHTLTDPADSPEFFIGDRVCIGGIKTGTLLYFGTIHVAAGQWCGIALDEAEGIHDGLVNDVRYFTCRKGHGIFAPVEKVVHLDKVSQVIKSPIKVSQIPAKSIKCKQIESEEISYSNRSSELIERCDDEIEGLDEDGIIHDSEEEAELYRKDKSRRKLPAPPKPFPDSSDESLIDDTVEKLQMMEDESDVEACLDSNRAISFEEPPELQHSAGGSSAGEDSWSLGKEIVMGDGKQYLNITFDGESESKTSTQEPSEESPSPEFIFDQEMIEDGEFSAQPMQMSRDSSLGILSSFTLDKTDLLYGLGMEEKEIIRLASQETLEASMSDKRSPDKQDENTSMEMDSSTDFDDNTEAFTSTPITERKISPNDTYAVNEINEEISSQSMQFNDSSLEILSNSTLGKTDLLHGLGVDETDIIIDVSQEILDNKIEADKDVDNMNTTFTAAPSTHILNKTFDLDENVEELEKGHINELCLKSKQNLRASMIDSGISLKGSLTESSLAPSSLKDSINDSVKGSLEGSAVHGQMVDSGIMVHNSIGDTSGVNQKGVPLKQLDINSKDQVVMTSVVGKGVEAQKDVIHVDMDDRKLMSDLRKGHQRKERPVSFLSTTSADTGYAPDTDSELGTLTLNSPQEWMDRGFHGNLAQSHCAVNGQSHDYPGEKISKLQPIPIESDSDVGMTTVDTDTEVDRAEIVRPVQAEEKLLSGVEMENIQEDMAESEDEITQIEDPNVKVAGEKDKMDGTFTVDSNNALNSTFTLAGTNGDQSESTPDNGDSCETTTESVSIVTVVIADKEEVEQMEKKEEKTQNKTPNKKNAKKKKFNVVKDFKKPNTNVTSKLSEYLKSPLPTKPKDDTNNTEKANNKKNLIKTAKVDFSKVTSKIDNKIIEEKIVNNVTEKKEKEIVEPVKRIKRTPPKSKWDAIMSQIASKEPPKPKTEVKSKLEAFSRIPPPAPPKKEEPPKPKRRISMGVPDYSKVQSKLKYTAVPAPPKPKKEETEKTDSQKDSRNVSKNSSPARPAVDSTKRSKSISLNASPRRGTSESPGRKTNGSSPARDKNEKNRKLSRDLDRVRNLSGDSFKRPEIRDKAIHIDLADSLDGRGSRTGTGSVLSSRPSSVTDMSTTGGEDDTLTQKMVSHLDRAMSVDSLRRGSIEGQSELSETGSQGTETRQRRSLVPPKNSLDSSPDTGDVRKSGPRIVKPVIRQHSTPSPQMSILHPNKTSLFTNKANPEKTSSRRSRNQNRNKTSRSKSDKHEKAKPPETVLAEVHHKEVHRLEALCEARTKQLNMVKLQLANSNQAFDGMSTVVNYLANDLEAFLTPSLLRTTESLSKQTACDQQRIEVLEKQRTSLEEIVQQLKEQHKEYVNNLERESEHSLVYQKESLDQQFSIRLRQVEEKRQSEIVELKRAHECHLSEMRLDYVAGQERLNTQHREDIRELQRKQDHQMEELHKQHQNKLEDITSRFDGIKLSLSEKVEDLRNECERLRNRAKACEEALQRDSDYKVQCALAPYKNLPNEIESLKMVVEMRNEEINKLRTHNIELQKKLEELPIAQEKIIALNQKKENLEAIISMKTDHEKVLHERCQNLMRKYDKESRANKRLSMEYEELMWKLSESFEESELGSQEALFYKKLSEGESPTPMRRLRTPSNSDSSPSKSPSFKRSVSSSADDREEKKFKRRSGNYLLDERRHRPTSPLARDNPLTKSWSPSMQSPSPTRMHTSSPNRMSQSWCVDMEVFDDPPHSPIPKSQSDHRKGKNGKKKNVDVEKDRNGGAGDFQESVSNEVNKSLKDDNTSSNNEFDKSSHSNGRSVRKDSRTGRETNVFNKQDSSVKETTLDNVETENVTSESSGNVGSASSPTAATMTCPPSKLPMFRGDNQRQKHEVQKSKSHRESAV